MKKTTFILLLVISLMACKTKEENTEHPNVIVISVDDLRDWVGYLGGYKGTVYTPNIDRLAASGVAFTNAHTAATVCCPSRNALMLGKRPSTTGLYNNGQWWKATHPQEITLAQYFKNNGYYTAGAGKVFHHTPGNNPPCSWNEFQDQVFDDPWNFADWSAERYFLSYGYRGEIVQYPEWKPLNGIYPIRSELDWGAIPGKEEKDYGDVQVVNYAKAFLQKQHEKPFFLALGTYRPHMPWHVPQKYFDMYPLNEVVLPEIKEDDLDDIPEEGKKLAMAGSRDFFQIRDEGKWKEAVQAYLASITFADKQVGDILDALQNSGFAKNTIVVLWSDHGWHLGTKQHWHKQTLWEECTQIPFIITAPGTTKPNSLCDKPVDMVNVFPTLVSLCKLPEKTDLDGHDMSPLLRNPNSDWAYPAISEIKTGNVSIRTQNWHFIHYKDGTEELYDSNKDPNEWNNLLGQNPDKSILEELNKWVPKTFAESVPDKNSFYFDPYQYTYLNRETKEFIDGKK
ncbi:sulfatase-like hydrolase/transferase [Maribellus comscasis]|uniref:Sulfatase-like hydrolase/transferase n=1 Tax=Maribellus comscasis TaxID=2681766 RepID=A0A6I6JP71_9BACT|nr:sulfatase [Maribellus comscasis]QGY44261.1 sulfatase-like hydrolase/transferase [Maribellus comscasis]